MAGEQDRRRVYGPPTAQNPGPLSFGRFADHPAPPTVVSRPYISKPFDFQHLTHTGRQQFPTRVLDQASENELVAEYWAVRASQRPRPELHGIKAEDLHFRNFSSDALDRVASSEAVSPVSARTPPALSRKVSKDLPMLPETQPSSPTSGRSMRHSRSVESFSQPYIKHRVSPPFASIQPPPRVSSRMALTRYDEPDRPRPLSIYESTSPPPSSTRLAGSRASGMWDRVAFNPVASPASPDAGVAVAVAEGVHAVTTADDVAVAAAAASPGYGLALENVPEEPEGYFDARPRPAARASDGRTTPESQSPPDSPGVMMAFRERRPSAVARKHDSCSTASSSSSRSASRCFDSLGSPFQSPAHGQRAPRFASFKRQSVFFRGDSTSWEDDIDYCYEHAAEADCDFDWDRNSLGEEDEEGVESEPFAAGGQVSASLLASFDSLTTRTTEADEDELPEEPEERKPSGSRARGHFYPGPFRPSLVVTDAPLPELDYDTTLKTATTDGATTPSDVFGGPQPPYSPSANGEVSADFGVKAGKADEAMREAMYEDIITTAVAAGEYDDDDAAADRHYPFLHPEEQQHQHLVNGPHHAASTAGSTRSSRTRLSKRSSYDSSVRSTGTASVFFSARRSAGSVGSLPELVWSSRRATRKTLEAPTVDAFADFGFFARFADEKANDEADVKAMDEAREDEIVAAVSPDEPMPTATAVTEASTPMAAMASTTSTTTHTFHHDRSASEGAAKLLFGSSPTRPARKRAASSGAGAMLSLFPPPVPTRVIQ